MSSSEPTTSSISTSSVESSPTTSSESVVPPAPTIPTFGPVTAEDLVAAAARVAALDDRDLAASVLMVSSSGAVGTDLLVDVPVGGVILMGSRGILDGTEEGLPQEVVDVVDGLQANAGDLPILIGTDQEYGTVSRLINGFTGFPGAGELGELTDPAEATALAEQLARAAADELRAVGIDVNFAPVADLLPVSGESAIGDRAYGSDPEATGALVAAVVRGYQAGGVAATAKHFPGLGPVEQDTHIFLPEQPLTCAEWNARDAVPFAAARDAGVAAVMTGHVTFPAIGVEEPASLSRTVITDLLSGAGVADCVGLGYQGLRITDSLQMAPVVENHESGSAAVVALTAGQDLLLMPADPRSAVDGIESALADGTLSRDRLLEAATKVTALRIALARVPRPDLSVVGSDAHQDLVDQVSSF